MNNIIYTLTSMLTTKSKIQESDKEHSLTSAKDELNFMQMCSDIIDEFNYPIFVAAAIYFYT